MVAATPAREPFANLPPCGRRRPVQRGTVLRRDWDPEDPVSSDETDRGKPGTFTAASALGTGSESAARGLVFEYMVSTLVETGRVPPATEEELPLPLRRELEHLTSVYRQPGALFAAYSGVRGVGCVGVALHDEDHVAEIKRLYVQPEFRGKGVATMLMTCAHAHALRHGIARLILDVLPAREQAISLYRDLGYEETEPFATEALSPMTYMERVTGQGKLPR